MTKAEAIDNFRFFNEGDYITREMEESADIVLNILKTQQEEIEKKNTVIEEMARFIECNELDDKILKIYCDRTSILCKHKEEIGSCVSCIKEYFINKVEKENK